MPPTEQQGPIGLYHSVRHRGVVYPARKREFGENSFETDRQGETERVAVSDWRQRLAHRSAGAAGTGHGEGGLGMHATVRRGSDRGSGRILFLVCRTVRTWTCGILA